MDYLSGASEHICFDPNSFLSLIPHIYCWLLQGPFLNIPHIFGEFKNGLYILETTGTRPLARNKKVSFPKRDSSHFVSNSVVLFPKRLNSLFVITSVSVSIIAKSQYDVILWNVRLRHLPFNSMNYISSISFSSNFECTCTVCPLAR